MSGCSFMNFWSNSLYRVSSSGVPQVDQTTVLVPEPPPDPEHAAMLSASAAAAVMASALLTVESTRDMSTSILESVSAVWVDLYSVYSRQRRSATGELHPH